MSELTEFQLAAFDEIIDNTLNIRSDILPADWYEQTIVTPPGNALPRISYKNSPFWRKPVNCFHPNHPAKDITIMSIAQGGKTMMFINAGVAYSIAHNPQHIIYLTGQTELTKDAVGRLDEILAACDLSKFIKANLVKQRNNKSGDTALRKEFKGRRFVAGSITNHNMLRQNEAGISIADDLDAGRSEKDDTGSTIELIKGRTKAHEHRAKRIWVSSPQVKGTSLIEKQYERSTKELYYIPCQNPSCGKMISLKFEVKINDKESAGLKWKLDNFGRVIPSSVHYVCQICGSGFTDKRKYYFLNDGDWIPQTENPLEFDHYGFHLNGLYTPVGMTSWVDLAAGYVLCNPVNQPRIESEYQTFLNIKLGELYEPPQTEIKIEHIEKNIRGYEIGIIPEKESIEDGNGRIVLLTLAADLGGRYVGDAINSTTDDVRLDYEIWAHTESGSKYAIKHGSIGTFKPAFMEQTDERIKYSYDMSKSNNVWREFLNIIDSVYMTNTGRKMKVAITGLDTGFADVFVWSFIDRFNNHERRIVGLKGDKEGKPVTWGINQRNFKQSVTRTNLYTLVVGQLKDQLAGRLSLEWKGNGIQPPGFMNFPEKKDGLYSTNGYFSHYGSEERKIDKKNNFIWEKKTPQSQNHFFDVCIYNIAVSEILQHKVMGELSKVDKSIDTKTVSWKDFSDWLLEQYGLNSMLRQV